MGTCVTREKKKRFHPSGARKRELVKIRGIPRPRERAGRKRRFFTR